MNNDLISRSELKKEIEKHRPKSTVKSLFLDGLNCMFMNCISVIDNAPTAERPQGEWLHHEEYTNDRPFYITECPFCKLRVQEETNFCPNCGAKMKGGAE